jgi:hypothetical protein
VGEGADTCNPIYTRSSDHECGSRPAQTRS